MNKEIVALVLAATWLTPAMAGNFTFNQLNPKQVISGLKAQSALTPAVEPAPIETALHPWTYTNQDTGGDMQFAKGQAAKAQQALEKLNYQVIGSNFVQADDGNYGFTIQYTAKEGYYPQPLQHYRSTTSPTWAANDALTQSWSQAQKSNGAAIIDLFEVMYITDGGHIYWFESTFGYPLKAMH